MASHNTKKESTLFLWMIAPAAVILTLLFVRWNAAIIPPKEILDGSRGTEMSAPPQPSQDAHQEGDATFH